MCQAIKPLFLKGFLPSSPRSSRAGVLGGEGVTRNNSTEEGLSIEIEKNRGIQHLTIGEDRP